MTMIYGKASKYYEQGATAQQAVRAALEECENEICMNCQSYRNGVCSVNGKKMNMSYSACPYFKSKKEARRC